MQSVKTRAYRACLLKPLWFSESSVRLRDLIYSLLSGKQTLTAQKATAT